MYVTVALLVLLARYGKESCVWVVPRPGVALNEASVCNHSHGKLRHFNVPKHVRIMSQLPMTGMGKAQKFAMRAEMLKSRV